MFSREKQNQWDVYAVVYVCGGGQGVERERRKEEEGERLVYFKEFSLTVVVAGKSKICRAGWQAGGSGRVAV